MNKSFFDYYELYSSTENIEKFSSEKEKCCRYCGKSEPDTTFNLKPHLLPELFGRNNITWNFECDSCNTKFQKLETDFSNYIIPFLTLTNTKTKKGIPKFQSRKTPTTNSTMIESMNGLRKFNFSRNIQDFEYLEEDKRLNVNLQLKPFVPFSLYKLLLKIGISLFPAENLEDSELFVEILNEDNVTSKNGVFFTLFRYRMDTKYFQKPSAYLYKAKETVIENDQFPEYALIIYTSNLIFQFFLPLSVKNRKEYKETYNLHLDLFPFFIFELNESSKTVNFHVDRFDLFNKDKVKVDESISFKYENKKTDNR